jgi:hypothetical protein
MRPAPALLDDRPRDRRSTEFAVSRSHADPGDAAGGNTPVWTV